MTRPIQALPSAWLTLAIFVVVAHFNPEVLTGSTRVENYLTLGNLLGMLFYGFQVAVIADIAVRFAFRWRTILIVGAIYGIFEEGFAVMTMESPSPPGFANILRVGGLNLAWATYIALFHATISVVSTIMIVRLVWPNRVSSPFLGKRHYAVIIPVMVLVYAAFIRSVTSAFVPEPSAIAILAIACFALAYLASRSRTGSANPDEKPWPHTRYALMALVLVLLSGLVPYLFAITTIGGVLVPFLIILCGYSFCLLFDRYERDGVQAQRKAMILFSVLVGFWLVFSTPFRTPLSSIVAYGGFAVEFLLGWRSVRKSEGAIESTQTRPTGMTSSVNEAELDLRRIL
jgi:hypothetical protein